MRKVWHRFFTFFLVVGSILLLADIAKACSCGKSPTIDIAFQQTPNVAILKVESVVKYQKGEAGFFEALPNRVKESRLKVVKVFKGNLQVGQELIFGEGSSSTCTFTFGENLIGRESLLFLASQPTNGNLWEAGWCTRGSSLASTQTDLMYLNNLERVKGKTRVSGVVMQVTPTALEEVPPTYKILAKRNLYLSGNGKKIELNTDRNGIFEIYDLLPGRYEITTGSIEGYRPSLKNSEFVVLPDGKLDQKLFFNLQSGGQAELGLVFEIDNSIGGKLLDKQGKPLERVWINLKPAKGKEYRYFYNGNWTEKDGSFNFGTVPPGEYVIVINKYGYISGDSPFGTFYYPDKVKIEEAEVISIGAGKHLKDLKIVPPSMLETVMISGKVHFENDSNDSTFRHLKVKVRFEPSPAADESKARVFSLETFLNQDGTFSLRSLKGQKGKLFLTGGILSLMPNQCQQAQTYSQKTLSEIVEIEGNNDVGGIELKAQLPVCEKAKID